MQTASRLQSSARSCGWMPSTVKLTRPPRSAASVGPVDGHARARRRAARAHTRSARARARARRPCRAPRGSRRPRRARPPRRSPGCRPRTSPAAAAQVEWSSSTALDHRPAAEERRHLLEQLAAAPEHADAGRAEHLVAGEGVEVRAGLLRRRRAAAAPPGRRRRAPSRPRRARARAISATGLIVPSTFETWVERDQLHAPPASCRVELVEVEPAVAVDAPGTRGVAPCSSHSSCQGTMFEWCSIARDQRPCRPRRRARAPTCSARG